MPTWLVDVLSGVAATVISALLLIIARRVDRFLVWLRDQGDIVDALDRAGAQLAAAAGSLAESAARIERATARISAPHRH